MDFENYILAMQYFCCLEIWEISKHNDCAIIEFNSIFYRVGDNLHHDM